MNCIWLLGSRRPDDSVKPGKPGNQRNCRVSPARIVWRRNANQIGEPIQSVAWLMRTSRGSSIITVIASRVLKFFSSTCSGLNRRTNMDKTIFCSIMDKLHYTIVSISTHSFGTKFILLTNALSCSTWEWVKVRKHYTSLFILYQPSCGVVACRRREDGLIVKEVQRADARCSLPMVMLVIQDRWA